MDGTPIDAFAAAARWFLSTSAHAAGCEDQPGLDQWSVRDLLGHTSRALSTVEAYLDGGRDCSPAIDIELGDAVAYYLAADVLVADPCAIVERGRAAGAALGEDPVGALSTLVERVLACVGGAPQGARVRTPVGVMTLAAYLPSRTVELTVHTCDLARALGLAADVPPAAARETFAVLGGLSAARGTAAMALGAMTGRHPVEQGFTLL